MEWNRLKEVNATLKKTDVKGKDYVEVNKRVMAFRELEPNGAIVTDIISCEDGVVVMRTTVTDGDGKVLSTGYAYEKESSSFINKTSYIENCETSAVGRALGFVGIGIDSSIASAEEVANAIHQQETGELATEADKKKFKTLCERLGVDYKEVLRQVGAKGQFTKEQYGKALHILRDVEESRK